MAQITVSFPRSVANFKEVSFIAANAQQLFNEIKRRDLNVFDVMFRMRDAEILPKAFVCVFVNDDQLYDHHQIFKDGDRIVFDVAIAGG